jgi:hypothetical protein
MIKLTAHPGPDFNGVFVFTIEAPDREPFVTDREAQAIAHLEALGAEFPERLIEQVREFGQILIAPK